MKPTKTLYNKCYGNDIKGLEIIAIDESFTTQEYIYKRYLAIEDGFVNNTDYNMERTALNIHFDIFYDKAPRAYKLYMRHLEYLRDSDNSAREMYEGEQYDECRGY